jgi:hypothetical protein
MPPSPFDDPVPRGNNVVLATLRITIAVQCWGAAVEWLALGNDQGLFQALTKAGGLTDAAAESVLTRMAWGLLLAGGLTLFRPTWVVLIPVLAWFAFVAILGPLQETSRLQPAIHAARYLGPMALLLLDFWPPRIKFSLGRAAVGLLFLRLGAVVTFAGEGLQALRQSREGGHLVELVSRTSENVLHITLTPNTAQLALGVVGGIELGLALALLLVRSRGLALLMTAVGLIVAASRVLALGPDHYPETLLRIGHAGLPFTLFLYWYLAVREQPPVTVPE